jgi:tetratricopeptide (TPR) repeat protein
MADARARRHFDAAAAWLARDLRGALDAYGAIVADHPDDTLALRVAQFGDLQWGRSLRSRVAAVLPHWNPDLPGYGHVLGMYAFGLAETGDAVRAEQVGRTALACTPGNAAAIHAVAHAFEMQGRAADGIAWLEQTATQWTASSYAIHLWWHRALFHLDLGDVGMALSILDWRIRANPDADAATLVDASSLLWRLQLLGIDTAGRWQTVADAWTARPLDGLRPFNDTHAMLAFVGAHRPGSAATLMTQLRASATRTRDLGRAVYQAALPVCAALIRFGRGDYSGAADRLLRHRRLTERCGGSHAQCDLLHLTLLESALRSGQADLSRELSRERVHLRPHSRLNAQLVTRARGVAQSLLAA